MNEGTHRDGARERMLWTLSPAGLVLDRGS